MTDTRVIITSEEEIDRLAVAQADDDSAWENPIRVCKSKSFTASLSTETAAEDSQKALPIASGQSESK